MKIAVIIPAFNEEASISAVVNEVISIAQKHQLSLTCIVINDCSTDNTGKIISSLPCTALHLPINLGIGGTVQTGLRFALQNNFDAALQLDGDGQHPASSIPDMIYCMEKGLLDVVIGSRYLEKKGFQSSYVRRAGIRYFAWLNNLLTGQKIHDSTSGFRLLNQKAIRLMIDCYPDEYPEPEALILYHKFKLNVGEFPVRMRERQGGKSSINRISAIYYMIKVTLAILFTFLKNIKN